MPVIASKKDLQVGAPDNLADEDFRRRKSIRKLLTVTCLLALLNLVICEIAARFVVYVGKPAASENPQYHLKYLVAKSLTNAQDNIVLCGDSLMKAGLYPELVTAKLKEVNDRIRVVNLAANAGTQADAIMYLEFLRKRGIKPKLVVFDYEVTNTGAETAGHPESRQPTSEPRSTAHRSPVHSPQAAAPQKHPCGEQPSRGYLFTGLLSRPEGVLQSFDVLLSDASYLVRHRGNIKSFIMEFAKAVQFPQRFERKAFFELRDWNDTGTTTEGMSPNHRLIPQENREEQRKAIWPFHASSPQSSTYKYLPDAYLPIIKYCQQQQLPLVLLWLPHQSSIYRDFYCQAPYTEAWFKQKFDQYGREPYVYPLYLNTLEERSSYYTDYRHLSTYGCVKASELFAAALSDSKYRQLVAKSASQPLPSTPVVH